MKNIGKRSNWNAFWDGFFSIFDWTAPPLPPPLKRFKPKILKPGSKKENEAINRAFQEDMNNLRSDWNNIVGDFNRAIDKTIKELKDE